MELPPEGVSVTEVNKKSLYRCVGKDSGLMRICGRKQLEVSAQKGEYATVSHPDWVVTQTIPLAELKPIK